MEIHRVTERHGTARDNSAAHEYRVAAQHMHHATHLKLFGVANAANKAPVFKKKREGGLC